MPRKKAVKKTVKKATKKTAKSNRKKVTQQNPLHLIYVLDETGSMQRVRDLVISAFNEYIKTVSSGPGSLTTKMSLLTFDSDRGIRRRFVSKSIKDIKDLSLESYSPAGATPLYDAVMEGIGDGEALEGHDVLMIIHTDGEENSSLNYSREDVFKKIGKLRKAGWGFLFMGADQDAWRAANAININSGNTLSFASSDTARAMMGAAVGTYNYGSASTADRHAWANDLLRNTTDLKVDEKGADLRK